MRLDQATLQNMYPAPTEEFAHRMAQLPHALQAKETPPVKHAIPRAAVIAALIVLILSSTAYALARPAVVDWLLGAMGHGSTELENTAQAVHGEANAEGVTIRITGAVYDGSQLALSYEAENAAPDQPVLIALDSQLIVDGQPHTLPHPVYNYNIHMVPSPHLDVLPVHRNPIVGGFLTSTLPVPLHGPTECAVTFIVYRPAEQFAVTIPQDDPLLDPTVTDAAYKAELNDALATLESFRNAVIVSSEADIPAGFTPVGSSGRILHALEDSHLKEAARITVRFTFDADNAIAYDFSGTQHALADCTADIAAFRLTPLNTYIDLRLIPQENTKDAALALADKYGAFTLVDEHGAPVNYSEMDAMFDFTPYITCMDGQWVCRYLSDLPGLLTFPASVGFTTDAGELLRFPLE